MLLLGITMVFPTRVSHCCNRIFRWSLTRHVWNTASTLYLLLHWINGYIFGRVNRLDPSISLDFIIPKRQTVMRQHARWKIFLPPLTGHSHQSPPTPFHARWHMPSTYTCTTSHCITQPILCSDISALCKKSCRDFAPLACYPKDFQKAVNIFANSSM